jgi:hypothetical protein
MAVTDIHASQMPYVEKLAWKENFKSRLDDLTYREAHGTLPAKLRRNPIYKVTVSVHEIQRPLAILISSHHCALFR